MSRYLRFSRFIAAVLLTLPFGVCGQSQKVSDKTGGLEVVLKRTLKGYDAGIPLHPQMFTFAEGVAAEISALVADGHDNLVVVVTGSADGIPNPGLDLDIEGLPLVCQAAVTKPINDNDLARLRGCVVREHLTGLMPSSSTSILWDSEINNEDDGKNIGVEYRSVWIEVFIGNDNRP